MYSEDDLEAAIAAGVIDRDAVERLRAYLAQSSRTVTVDEEHFRLITGFNDIFVSIACVLLLVALGWIGSEVSLSKPWLSGLLVAGASWGLALFFTAKRRMALPSILLLASFVGGLYSMTSFALVYLIDINNLRGSASIAIISGLVASAGAWSHWRRFHVPITVAVGAAAGVVVVMALIAVIAPDGFLWHYRFALAFTAGIVVFALAMRWDMSDPKRETRRTDVAFWLHLLAAPLIVHPIFAVTGVLDGHAGWNALAVIALYLMLGLIALAIDRRALMVSALGYVLFALSLLFQQFGAVNLGVALTALVLGSALLMLSAYWARARLCVLNLMPAEWRAKLPPANSVAPDAALPSA